MLASQDPNVNANDIPMTSRPQQSRSPQDTSYQGDNSGPSAVVAASAQNIDEQAILATHTADSSSRIGTLSILHSQIQLSEFSSPSTRSNPHAYSPSLCSNPQAYSPAFTSPTTPASTYIPPPSPTPSQKYSYSPPEGHQYYPQGDGASQQHQNLYRLQDPYQQITQQQQGYPEPIVHAYSEPALVDVNDKADQTPFMTDPTATSLAASQRRIKFIWIGVVITVLALGVAIGLVFGLKDNKDSGSGNSTGTGSFPAAFPPDFPFPTAFPSDFPFPSNFPFPSAWPSGFPMPTGFPYK
jgi:hypothetical protein